MARLHDEMRAVNGILLLYDHPLERPDAPTIMEHVEAFARHSRFDVWSVNTALGFPQSISELDFGIVVLHYSLFGWVPFKLDSYFERYLERSDAYKVAFFQDEHQFCPARFEFVDRFGLDCVYTLFEAPYWDDVYRKYTSVPKLVYTLPGYVSENLVAHAARIAKPDEERTIDVGYRTRTLTPNVGKGGQEKVVIARKFLDRARGSGLKLDIAVDEESRIYGEAWFEFVANCRGMIGTEAGVSIVDVEDIVRTEWERSGHVLSEWEHNIYYRTVSPRHFEAAALRVCQILYEGKYSGVLQPMVHYIPLKKDFSNLDEVMRNFRDPEVRCALTDNAYRDLIASGRYSYESFVRSFDEELISAGLRPEADEALAAALTAHLARELKRRRLAVRLRMATIGRRFRGREAIMRVVRPGLIRVKRGYRRWRYRRLERALARDGDA